MKKYLNSLGIILVTVLLISAGCNQQRSRSDLRENLSDIREELLEVVATIDEALVADNLSEFKNKTDNALSNLEDQIDNFQDEMNQADRRISPEAREKVINLQQRKEEVELKLNLLDNDGSVGDHHFLNYSDTVVTSRDGSGTAINQDRSGTRYGLGREAQDPREGQRIRDESGKEIMDGGHLTEHDYNAQRHISGDTLNDNALGQEGAIDRPATDHTAIDRPATDHTATEGEIIRAEADENYYGPSLQMEIVNDLKELQREIEEFIQISMYDEE
jgi:hypothetical protein